MPHPNNNNGERLIYVTGEHWIRFVLPAFVAALLMGNSILLFFLAGLSAHHEEMWLSHVAFVAGFLLLLLTHHWIFLCLLGETIDRIFITNQRSIQFDTRLLLHEEIRENSFDKMRTVEAVKEGLLQNVLNYGTIRFQGGIDIYLVPHPHRVAKAIEQAMGRR